MCISTLLQSYPNSSARVHHDLSSISFYFLLVALGIFFPTRSLIDQQQAASSLSNSISDYYVPHIFIMAYKPALLVVDMQNDYCPRPRGAFSAFGNRMDLVAPIKQSLSTPGFAMRITTLSEIPDNHKAMAHNNKRAKPGDLCIDLPNTKKGMGHKTVKQVALMKCCMKKT